MHLPSNVAGVGSEWNTPSRYTTDLPEDIRLAPGEWEVALDVAMIPLYRDTPATTQHHPNDVRHMPLVWIRTLSTPNAETRKKIINHHDVYYCMRLPADTKITTPKDALIAIADLEFNGTKIMTFDAKTNRLLSINADELGATFGVYIFKTLAQAMGFTIDSHSLEHVILYSFNVNHLRPLWYNFNTVSHYPKVSRALVQPIKNAQFETAVLNLNEHNVSEDPDVTKVMLVSLTARNAQNALYDQAYGEKGKDNNYDYPFDIMPALLQIRLRGNYTVMEVLLAIINTQRDRGRDAPNTYGMLTLVKGGFRTKSQMTKDGESTEEWSYIMHKTLAVQLGLTEIDPVREDGNVTKDLLKNMGLDQAKFVLLRNVTHTVNYSKVVDYWTKRLSAPRPKTFKDRDFSSIFVNTDLVDTHWVGNIKSDTLRVIHVNPLQREVYERYANPQFYPLRTSVFRKITIYLTDEQARQIEMKLGLTLVTLLFRRIKK